jgi:uncharacterized protein
MIEVVQVFESLALGAAGDALGGLFGIGGGVILIPTLALLYGLPQQVAQGTTLVMVAPSVLLSFLRYRRRVPLDLRIAVMLGLSALLAAYPMARLATALDPRHLRLAFAGFLALLAAIVAERTRRAAQQTPSPRALTWGWTALVGLAGGAVSGLFGVGGAFIVPPILTTFFGVRQIEAQGFGLALVSPGTIVALAAYAGAGQVDWALGIPLMVGGMTAISAGVAVAHRLPERRLRFAFCGLLIITAALLVLRR